MGKRRTDGAQFARDDYEELSCSRLMRAAMPSPFPGMDPYLEGSMNFHHQFSAEIARQLSPKLLPKYVAVMAERFVLDVSRIRQSIGVEQQGIVGLQFHD